MCGKQDRRWIRSKARRDRVLVVVRILNRRIKK
jgi:hypothetical protein